MGVLRPVVAPSTTLMSFCDSKVIDCGSIRFEISRISITSTGALHVAMLNQLLLKGHVTHTGTVKWFSAKGVRIHSAESGGRDVFVHISAVERAGLLAEAQKITYELIVDTRSGKTSADQLRVAA